jgi:diadenosine tetraphosphate (Ap4A) HIT family hydrolase
LIRNSRKKHAARNGKVFELAMEDQQDLWLLVAQVRQSLIERYGADAFNIGINDGLTRSL